MVRLFWLCAPSRVGYSSTAVQPAKGAACVPHWVWPFSSSTKSGAYSSTACPLRSASRSTGVLHCAASASSSASGNAVTRVFTVSASCMVNMV